MRRMKWVGTPMSLRRWKKVLANPVGQDTLAFDHLVLLGVECGRVILEMLDEGAGLGALVEDLGLAFIDASAAVHAVRPWLEEIHARGLF